MLRLLRALTLLLACPGAFAIAQDPPAPTTTQQPTVDQSPNQQALENLATQLADTRNALEAARRRADGEAITRITKELDRVRWQFAELAAHFDVEQFEQPKAHEFDIKSQIEDLLRPLVLLLKKATEEPRLVTDLNSQLEALQQRQEVIERAIRTVERTRDGLPADSPARGEAQRELDQRWRPQLESARREILVTRARWQQLNDAQKPLWDRLSGTGREFVQSSGLSLLLCAIVFVTLFFGLRVVVDRIVRRQARNRAFSMRLLEVVLQVVTLLIALIATLAVPYVRNDWLLLAIGIVFLVGSGWALMRVLPLLFEQIQLILNVGGVREGERMLIDGLPYRVEALRFQSRLVNPELDGGELRLPIKSLIGLRSRPCGADEPWFPCRTGDVVALSDGVLGVVQQQTPEFVVIAERLDAPRSYVTTNFLQLHPKNLSRGFCIKSTFGIDYSHQDEAASTVPERLRAFVAAGIATHLDENRLAEGTLISLRVELRAAGPSSIDYAVLAEFDGSLAERYHELQRLLVRLLVTACTHHGYRIPFPQLTVHQAPA